MNTFISMLRGINVSGQKKIRMTELKSLYETLGLNNVQTYVQSGNVVFDSDAQDQKKLKRAIEAKIKSTFEFSVPVLIRKVSDFQRIIESHPFKNEEVIRVLVTFLYETPDKTKWEELHNHKDPVDHFALGEQEIFLFCPGGYGKTKLSNNFFERKLGVVATTRNWKTVNALYNLANKK